MASAASTTNNPHNVGKNTPTYEVEVVLKNLIINGPLPSDIKSASFDPMLACCIVERERASRDKGKPLGKGKFNLGNALDYSNKFNLKCNMHSETLQIELWDDNILRDTFLCCARIPLRPLLSVPGRGIGVMERQITFMPGEVHTLTGTKRGEPINATCIARLTRMDKGDAEIPPEAAGVSLREIPAGASALPGGLAAGGLAAGGVAAGGMAAKDVKITQPATAAISQPSTFVEQGVVYERGVQNVEIPSTKTVSEQVPKTIMTEEVVQVPKVIMVEEVVQVPKTVMETVYKEVPTSIPAQQEVVRPVGVERVTEVKERVLGAMGPAEPIGQPVPIASAGSNITQTAGQSTSGYGHSANLARGVDRSSNL